MVEPPEKPSPASLATLAITSGMGIAVVAIVCGLLAQVSVALVSLKVREMAQSVIGMVQDIGGVGSQTRGDSSGRRTLAGGPTVVIRLGGSAEIALTPSSPGSGTPAPTATPIVHVVRSGEALSLIADQYGVSVSAILRANSMDNPDNIFVGQRLIIPPSR